MTCSTCTFHDCCKAVRCLCSVSSFTVLSEQAPSSGSLLASASLLWLLLCLISSCAGHCRIGSRLRVATRAHIVCCSCCYCTMDRPVFGHGAKSTSSGGFRSGCPPHCIVDQPVRCPQLGWSRQPASASASASASPAIGRVLPPRAPSSAGALLSRCACGAATT